MNCNFIRIVEIFLEMSTTYVCIDECFTQQTRNHLFVSCSHQWQKDASNNDMIAGLCLACGFTAAQNGHRPWNVANWHLIAVLLNFQLLEFDEFRSTRLKVQSAARFINATIFRWTIGNGHKCQRINRLICFGAASIACVGGYHHHRFHFSATCYNTTNRNKFTDIIGFHLTN